MVSKKSIFQVELIWRRISWQIQCSKPHIHRLHSSQVTAVQSCKCDLVWKLSHALSPTDRLYFLLRAVTKWLKGIKWNLPHIILRSFYIDSSKKILQNPFGYDPSGKLLPVLYVGPESFLHFATLRRWHFFLAEYFSHSFISISWYRPSDDCVKKSASKTIQAKIFCLSYNSKTPRGRLIQNRGEKNSENLFAFLRSLYRRILEYFMVSQGS